MIKTKGRKRKKNKELKKSLLLNNKPNSSNVELLIKSQNIWVFGEPDIPNYDNTIYLRFNKVAKKVSTKLFPQK